MPRHAMLLHHALSALLLAQQAEDEPRAYAIGWAIVVASVVLGLVVALRPAKREEKVKKPKSAV